MQQVRARGAHDDEALREPRQLVDHRALRRIRRREDGVQRRHDRHAQLAQQREDVGAGLAAEDSVLVLHGQHVDVIDVQEVGGAPIRAEVALGDLEPDARRIAVPSAGIVHRQHERVDVRQRCRQRIGEVRRERGDAALARQVIAEDGESFHAGARRSSMTRWSFAMTRQDESQPGRFLSIKRRGANRERLFTLEQSPRRSFRPARAVH